MRIPKFLIPLFASFVFLSSDSRASIIHPDPVNIYELSLREFSKLNARTYTQLTGQRLNLKQRINFSLLKLSMKKEIRKNPGMTVGEFLKKKRDGEAGKSILAVILGVVLFAFLLFLVLYKD